MNHRPSRHKPARRNRARGLAAWAMAPAGWGVLTPAHAVACATCMGSPESPLTQGLNWGIFSLLLTVMFVLSGAAAFFVYLARRAAAFDDDNEAEERAFRSSATAPEWRETRS